MCKYAKPILLVFMFGGRIMPLNGSFTLKTNKNNKNRSVWDIISLAYVCLPFGYCWSKATKVAGCARLYSTNFFGKKSGAKERLAASQVNSQKLVNARRILPEKTKGKWTRDSCEAHFSPKNMECGRGRPHHMKKFTVTLNSRRVLFEKIKGIWKGCCDTPFPWKKMRISGAVGRL